MNGPTNRDLLETVLAVVAVARENEISLKAAGVGYYMFNSLVPLVVFLTIGFSVTGRFDIVAEFFGTLTGTDGERYLRVLEDVVGEGTGRARAAAIAGVLLAWSSLTMVQAINMAFGIVYNVRSQRSVIRTAVDSVVVFTTVLVSVPLFLAVVVSLTAFADDSVVRLFSVPLVFLTLLVAFLPMYYRFPGETITLREALPGAAFAAATWTACAIVFVLYVTTSQSVRLYGVAGAVMLLLTWLYVGGLTLLVGGITNAVLAGRVDADSEWMVLD